MKNLQNPGKNELKVVCGCLIFLFSFLFFFYKCFIRQAVLDLYTKVKLKI